MIFPFVGPTTYAVTVVGPPASSASLGEDGTVAEIREPQALIWRDNKELWHGTGYTRVAGPNVKGQIALVGPTGLSLWSGGKVEKCEGTSNVGVAPGSVPDTLLGISDAGKIIAVCHGVDSAYSVVTWPKEKDAAWPLFQPTAMSPTGSFAGITWGFMNRHESRPSAYLQDLSSKVGLGEAGTRVYPTAISRKGTVVGWQSAGLRDIPVVLKPNGATPLPIPGEDSRGKPVALNDRGEIVGSAGWTERNEVSVRNPDTVALWVQGKFTDLNSLLPDGWRLSYGFAINDRGWILANGSQDDKPGQLLLLKPIADR